MNLQLRFTWQDLYFKIMWILTAVLYVLMPLGNGLLGLTYIGIHVITVVAFFARLLRSKTITTFDGRRLAAMALFVTAILISAIASESKISFSNHIMGAMSCLEMLMAIYIIDSLKYKKSLTRFVFWVNIIISLIFSTLYFTPYAYSSDIVGFLNLGYANPNAAAIYLLMNVAILTVFFEKDSKWFVKILLFAIGAFLIYMLYLTQSRMCLIAAIFILVYRFFLQKVRPPKWMIWVFIFVPLVFLFLYASLYQKGQHAEQMFLGKDLFSGREGYFVEMLQELKDTWLIGDLGAHYFSNAHNGPLALLLNVGVLGYGAYLWFVSSTLKAYHKRIRNYTQAIALVAIFAVFAHSCAEAAMTVGGANYSILLATLYWILKGADEDDEKKGTAQ